MAPLRTGGEPCPAESHATSHGLAFDDAQDEADQALRAAVLEQAIGTAIAAAAAMFVPATAVEAPRSALPARGLSGVPAASGCSRRQMRSRS